MSCQTCQIELTTENKYPACKYCKKCYNKRRTTFPSYLEKRKKAGMFKLTPEERFSLFRRLENKEISFRKAAEENGIKLNTLYVWFKNFVAE